MEIYIILSFVLILMTLTLGLWISSINRQLQAVMRIQMHWHLHNDKDFQKFLKETRGE